MKSDQIPGAAHGQHRVQDLVQDRVRDRVGALAVGGLVIISLASGVAVFGDSLLGLWTPATDNTSMGSAALHPQVAPPPSGAAGATSTSAR